MSRLTVLQEPTDEDGKISITHGTMWNTEVVNNFNWKLLRLCDRFVVAESRMVLSACVSNG